MEICGMALAASMPPFLQAHWGAKLPHPAWEGLTKSCSLKMPTAPLLRNSGTFYSAEEETQGGSAWGRDRNTAGPLGGKARKQLLC